MSCCPCFPSKKKYAKKLKEEGVKNNNKKKYKQKKGGKNVEMPAIAHTTDVHMDRTEEEKQKDVDAFRSMFKSKNTKKKTNVGKDENSSASIRSINVEEKKNSINDNNSNNNVSLTKKTSISDVIHEGYLWKKGGGTSMFGKKNWKKRWFALHTDLKLSYYDDENENHLKGVIHIHGARLRVTANTGKIGSHHQKHTIIITQKPPQPPRPYEVVAETPERHEKWLEVLNVAIRAKKPEVVLESV